MTASYPVLYTSLRITLSYEKLHARTISVHTDRSAGQTSSVLTDVTTDCATSKYNVNPGRRLKAHKRKLLEAAAPGDRLSELPARQLAKRASVIYVTDYSYAL